MWRQSAAGQKEALHLGSQALGSQAPPGGQKPALPPPPPTPVPLAGAETEKMEVEAEVVAEEREEAQQRERALTQATVRSNNVQLEAVADDNHAALQVEAPAVINDILGSQAPITLGCVQSLLAPPLISSLLC